jgi:hypothetical protein
MSDQAPIDMAMLLRLMDARFDAQKEAQKASNDLVASKLDVQNALLTRINEEQRADRGRVDGLETRVDDHEKRIQTIEVTRLTGLSHMRIAGGVLVAIGGAIGFLIKLAFGHG